MRTITMSEVKRGLRRRRTQRMLASLSALLGFFKLPRSSTSILLLTGVAAAHVTFA